MSGQPEALRLADELDCRGHRAPEWQDQLDAASELRRLHNENQAAHAVGIQQERDMMALEAEVERLRAELTAAYAEIRKQVAGSKVVFDRELVKRAKETK